MTWRLCALDGMAVVGRPFRLPMRKLFAVFLVVAAATISANELSYRSLQSGWFGNSTPMSDHGLHGEGQIIAVLDTGVDWTSCYFAESDNSRPPVNTGSPTIGPAWENVDLSRRKIVAYDFLYSCDQFPGASGCDDPSRPDAWDNQGHGTHAAASAAGDRGAPLFHDYLDAIATGAKLIVQDAGYIGGDNCSQRPGIGCPTALTPILDQAYRQGARIHSNSWGDRQNTPWSLPAPTANYSQSARDVDAFVWTHPDMLVVFNTGNGNGQTVPPAYSLSAPGCAKNTLQVGGTRGNPGRDDSVLAGGSLVGPTRDGRIKPDVVGPAYVTAGDLDMDNNPATCDISAQPGTSWASPTIAGAVALVRQYYTAGFYPSGMAKASEGFTPSAALLKATIIAAAQPVPRRVFATGLPVTALPVPSPEQGWGFPVFQNVFSFAGDARKLRIADVPIDSGIAQGSSALTKIDVRVGTPLKIVLVWTDPPGVVRGTSDPTPELVNDLDLRVIGPGSELHFGNEAAHAGQRDQLNNVEVVSFDTPAAGTYTVAVDATRLGIGPRQSYALVITGDLASQAPVAPRRTRAVRR